ncbi:MAG TPA: hypothetical protein DCX06_12900 [Opitutae bacterium]|nr:hypothetical protein [Opitutae bacterium]
MLQKELRDSCYAFLKEGSAKLKLPIGIVSHIYNNLYKVVAINLQQGDLTTGATFPLSQTYCRDVFTSEKIIAITEIDGVPGLQRHPLYVSLPLEAYIGAPIHHNGIVWGTVNFSSPEHREPFSECEITLVKSYADAIGKHLDEIDALPKGALHRTHVASRAPFKTKK